MFTTCLTLLVVSIQTGQVVSVPHSTPVLHAGRFNWILQEQSFQVELGTRGIVVRVAPEGMEGVVEVKLFDGTNRLGWLPAAHVTVLHPTPAARSSVSSSPTSSSPPTFRRASASTDTTAIRKRKQIQRRQLAAIDAILGSMIQAALQADAMAPRGPILLRPEVIDVSQFLVRPEVIDVSQFLVPIR